MAAQLGLEGAAPPGSRPGLRDLPWLTGAVWRAAPGPTVAWTGLALAGAFLDGGELFTLRGAVDALVAPRGAAQPLPWLIAMGAVSGLGAALGLLRPYARERVRLRAGRALQGRVLDCVTGLPLEAFDSEGTWDLVRRAADGADRRGPDLLGEALGVAEALPAMLANAAALALVTVWLPAVVLATMLLLLWQRARFGARQRELDVRWTRTRRLADYCAGVLRTRTHGAEVRLWGLRDLLLDRWRRAFGGSVDAALRLEAGNALRSLPGLVGMPVVFGVALASVALFGGRVPAGDAALVLTALRSLFILISHYGGSVQAFVGHASYAADLRALQALPREVAPAGAVPLPHPLREGIRLRGVSYRYPGASVPALDGIDLHIRAGEVVALVGPNGAGKSTLAALLLGLYEPAHGRVAVGAGGTGDGGGRRGAVFQDFARYSLTVRDNVAFGDLTRREDEAALRAALGEAGSDLAESLDDWLGPEFGGRDLSGGEWLRVAIARGVVGRRPFLVLDEPTAAMDPLAEVDLVRKLLALGRERTAVVVSHRLGVARMADRILVMDGGRLVEDGTHEELVAAGGLYARMWQAQASWYVPMSHGASPTHRDPTCSKDPTCSRDPTSSGDGGLA